MDMENYTPSGPSTYIIIPRLLILVSSLFNVIKNISDVLMQSVQNKRQNSVKKK